MKKKLYFDLLVDISSLLQQYINAENYSESDAARIRCMFEDRYEIWRYNYNKSTKLYEVDSCIYSQSRNQIIRFVCDPRLFKMLGFYYPGYAMLSQEHHEKLRRIRHFSSIESASLIAAIEGAELFICKRPSDSIPISISFGEILKKWKRLS